MSGAWRLRPRLMLTVALAFGGTGLGSAFPVNAWAAAAGAIDVHDFASADLEARYRRLIAELRCPQCLNTNLAGSDAPTAKDLRAAVARLLKEGKSDREIVTFLQSRYGDFILYRPPFRPDTYLPWLLPGVLLLLGGVWVVRIVARSRQTKDELTEAERARIAAILADRPDGDVR